MDDPLTRAEHFLDHHGILNAPGAVLYSAADTLKPGPVYLVGLNPGGLEDWTLRQSIAASRTGKNEFIDTQWSTRSSTQKAGQAHMQKRV